MKSEARRRFKHGFNLNEQELRRLFDIICNQMDSTTTKDGYTTSFEIKFHNGVIAKPGSIDEIISQENIGSSAIRRLSISVDGNDNHSDYGILIQFVDPDKEGSEDSNSIKYKISGTDRDWVFVTDSLIDERIGRMKTFSLKPSFFKNLPMIFTQLLLIVFLFTSFSYKRPAIQRLSLIEGKWNTNEITDIGKLIIEVEKFRIESNDVDFRSFLSNWDGVFIIIAILLLGISLFGEEIFRYIYPPYNFLWGDYIQVYENRRSKRNFFFVVIILGIILSIVGNFLYDFLKNL